MQALRIAEPEQAALVGLGVRVLLLSTDPNVAETVLVQRLAGMGGQIEVEAEIYAALSAMIDDPGDYGLFVMDCDGFGGIEAGRRAVAMMSQIKQTIPAILISADCRQQTFPEEGREPVQLRAPCSAVSLRVGMEHALRGRLMWLRD